METLVRIPVFRNAPTFAVEAVRAIRDSGQLLGKGPTGAFRYLYYKIGL